MIWVLLLVGATVAQTWELAVILRSLFSKGTRPRVMLTHVACEIRPFYWYAKTMQVTRWSHQWWTDPDHTGWNNTVVFWVGVGINLLIYAFWYFVVTKDDDDDDRWSRRRKKIRSWFTIQHTQPQEG